MHKKEIQKKATTLKFTSLLLEIQSSQCPLFEFQEFLRQPLVKLSTVVAVMVWTMFVRVILIKFIWDWVWLENQN